MNSKLRESISQYVIGPYCIRVWRQEEEFGPIDVAGLRDSLKILDVKYNPQNKFTIDQIAKFISNLPKVNAVEVKNEEGEGILYYNNWP